MIRWTSSCLSKWIWFFLEICLHHAGSEISIRFSLKKKKQKTLSTSHLSCGYIPFNGNGWRRSTSPKYLRWCTLKSANYHPPPAHTRIRPARALNSRDGETFSEENKRLHQDKKAKFTKKKYTYIYTAHTLYIKNKKKKEGKRVRSKVIWLSMGRDYCIYVPVRSIAEQIDTRQHGWLTQVCALHSSIHRYYLAFKKKRGALWISYRAFMSPSLCLRVEQSDSRCQTAAVLVSI